MAKLTNPQIQEVFNLIVRDYLNDKPVDIVKKDFKDAIQAADNWIDDNALAFNAILPLPFRVNASVATKAALLAFVTLRKGNR